MAESFSDLLYPTTIGNGDDSLYLNFTCYDYKALMSQEFHLDPYLEGLPVNLKNFLIILVKPLQMSVNSEMIQVLHYPTKAKTKEIL